MEIFAKKVGFSSQVLKKTLWGDFYINTKSKKIMKGAQEKAKKPLFVQLILENIWTLYDAIYLRKVTTRKFTTQLTNFPYIFDILNAIFLSFQDKDMVAKMVTSLNVDVPPRDLKQSDCKQIALAVLSRWLPLSSAILGNLHQFSFHLRKQPAVFYNSEFLPLLYRYSGGSPPKPKNAVGKESRATNVFPIERFLNVAS